MEFQSINNLDSFKKASLFDTIALVCHRDLGVYVIQTRIQKFSKEGGGVEEGKRGGELKMLGRLHVY